MHEADVYVVRVYRRSTTGVSGIVENVRQGTSSNFRDAGELIELIVGDARPDRDSYDTDEGGL